MKSKLFTAATAAVLGATGLSHAPAQAGPDPYIAELMLFGGNFCPRGWTEASGQLLAISPNTALFSILGTTYGGDGRTTFGLPDLRGRVPLGQGSGPGLSSYQMGQRSGSEQVTLTAAEMPSHNHSVETSVPVGTLTDPAAAEAQAQGGNVVLALANQSLGSINLRGTAANTGGSISHNNMQPFLAMRWCIATQGVFPPRS